MFSLLSNLVDIVFPLTSVLFSEKHTHLSEVKINAVRLLVRERIITYLLFDLRASHGGCCALGHFFTNPCASPVCCQDVMQFLCKKQ